jgi:hypothetical protein
VGIQGDVQEVCLPIGFRVFSDGEGYFHGGLSLQEAVVPVIVFRRGEKHRPFRRKAGDRYPLPFGQVHQPGHRTEVPPAG